MKALLTTIAIFLFALGTPTYAKSAGSLSQLNALTAKHQGKVIYVDFWASWCVPCRKSFPWLNKINTKYAQDGLVVIAVNLDEESSMATEFLQKWPANFTVLYDPEGETAEHFQLKGMPSSFMIDRSGKVAVEHVGFFANKTNQYEQEIQHLLHKPTQDGN